MDEGGGGHGGAELLPRNLSLRADVAEANGRLFGKALPVFLVRLRLLVGCSMTSNWQLGLQVSVLPLFDSDNMTAVSPLALLSSPASLLCLFYRFSLFSARGYLALLWSSPPG